MALNMPQGYTQEVLEGFADLQAMENWYRSLPPPWNKIPKPVGKKQDILKNISLIFDTEKTFFGGKDDGSYFSWRAQVIENIHRQPLSVGDKVNQVSRAINKDKALLKAMFSTQAFTALAYKNIIYALETNFGGPSRAHAHLLKQLLKGDPLEYGSHSNVQLLRTRIDKYLELLAVHGINNMVEARTIFDIVVTNLMTEFQATKFREDAITHRYANPNSLEALSGWLQERERNLQWTSTHHNVDINLRQLTNKPNRKVRVYKISGQDSDGYEGWEDDVVHTFPTRPEKKFIKDEIRDKRKPSTTLRVSEEQSVSDTESLQTCSEIGEDFIDEEPQLLIQCLRTMGVRLPLCNVCNKERHVLHQCEVFRKMSVPDRLKLVNQQGRCDNCLHPRHRRKDCPSKFRCFECKEKHHSLLHYQNKKLGKQEKSSS